MNQKPLDEMIRTVVDQCRQEGMLDARQIVERVLADPDVALLLEGVEDHDRSGDLRGVYVRDIRRKVEQYLA